MNNLNSVKPFLKWAGGKTQILEQIEHFLPHELSQGLIQRYIEPFVGGGAVFLAIAKRYPVDEFFISDINSELILAYKTIQQDVETLIGYLRSIQDKYIVLDEKQRKQYFYQVRSDFNLNRKQINFETYNSRWIDRTTQLIFLNRTCFNGLFRVNSKGEFNVPVGKYKNPKICDADNLRLMSKILQKTHIFQGDFTQCEMFVDDHSLVYFDPPYRPISKTAKFNSYSKDIFDDKEQLRLRDFFNLLNKKKAKLILSNSDPKNENQTDNFFEYAYADYRIQKIRAARNINSKGNKRGKINELLIVNY
jgi:DNA adenine methylase